LMGWGGEWGGGPRRPPRGPGGPPPEKGAPPGKGGARENPPPEPPPPPPGGGPPAPRPPAAHRGVGNPGGRHRAAGPLAPTSVGGRAGSPMRREAFWAAATPGNATTSITRARARERKLMAAPLYQMRRRAPTMCRRGAPLFTPSTFPTRVLAIEGHSRPFLAESLRGIKHAFLYRSSIERPPAPSEPVPRARGSTR